MKLQILIQRWDATISKLKLIEAKIEITYAANGAIFIAKAREMQYPAPPVANQNFDGPCF